MDNQKKYEMTDEIINAEGGTLQHSVKAGQLGGFVEREENLSHDGHAWTDDYAQVYGHARIYDNAHINNDAKIFGNARMFG